MREQIRAVLPEQTLDAILRSFVASQPVKVVGIPGCPGQCTMIGMPKEVHD